MTPLADNGVRRPTDADVKVIAKLRHLTMLLVGSSDLTDKGLAELGQMRTLRELDVSATQITDQDSGVRSNSRTWRCSASQDQRSLIEV